MRVTQEKLPKNQIKLKIELEEADMKKYREQAILRLADQVKIPGFRQGTATEDVIKMHVGEAAILRQIIDIALPQSYSKAVLDAQLPVASRPQVDITKEDPLTYEAIVALMPDVTVKDYKSIKVPFERPDVTDNDIDAVIKDLQKYYATYKPIERPVAKGDKVEIDFSGTDMEGKPLPGTASKNHPVVVGENTLLPDFEKELIGMQKGETKKFRLTFPHDYHHEPFKGKDVQFETTVQSATEPVYPDLTEDFIQQVTGTKKSHEELRKDVRANLETQRDEESRMKQEDQFLEKMLEKTEVDLPDQLLEEEVDYIIEDMKADLKERSIEFDQYLKGTKKTEAQIRKESLKEAEKRIKIRLALQYLFKEEGITVTDTDTDKELENAVARYPENQRAKAIEEYKKNDDMMNRIKNRVMLSKLFDGLLDRHVSHNGHAKKKE